jgi:hypothetical protein
VGWLNGDGERPIRSEALVQFLTIVHGPRVNQKGPNYYCGQSNTRHGATASACMHASPVITVQQGHWTLLVTTLH